MANVVNKIFTGSLPIGNGEIVLFKSVNTPDFDSELWIINPDLSLVDGYSKKYWKLDGYNVIPMTFDEQVLVDGYYNNSFNKDILLIDYVESSNTQSTTSTNPQEKLSLIANNLNYNEKYEV